jgi:hypothetical protein
VKRSAQDDVFAAGLRCKRLTGFQVFQDRHFYPE